MRCGIGVLEVELGARFCPGYAVDPLNRGKFLHISAFSRSSEESINIGLVLPAEVGASVVGRPAPASRIALDGPNSTGSSVSSGVPA